MACYRDSFTFLLKNEVYENSFHSFQEFIENIWQENFDSPERKTYSCV
jgi:hypothetical protein